MGLAERILGRLFPPRPEPLASVRRGRRVLVRGRVVPRDEIQSPLTGARCVYYRYLVEEFRRPSIDFPGGGGLWVAVEFDEAIAEFYLQDGSHRAIVAPQRARVELGRAAPEQVTVAGGRRAAESRLCAGDLVDVDGVADEIPDLLDGSRGYREVAARTLLRARDGASLVIRLLERAG